MLVDLLKNPDFKEYVKEIECMLQSQQANLEGAKTWEETVRTQSAIQTLRAVLFIPQEKAKLANDLLADADIGSRLDASMVRALLDP